MGRQTPVIYSWQDILSYADLNGKEKNILFPQNEKFSGETVRREYFSPYFEEPNTFLTESSFLPVFEKESSLVREVVDYIRLWEKPASLSSWKNENIPYKMFTSPMGKVIVSFPEKLPVDFDEGLILQEYLREASVFVNGKIYWTKVEGVIQ